eukprot:6068893-Amphidinium_carterae.1
MSIHYAPTFFSTLLEQKRDNLRALDWQEEQVRAMETRLRGEHLLELYTILPEKALNMWITCGRIPMSYMQQSTDNRHKYYNFHTEVHYAITDYINVYLYNIPT